MDQRYLHVANGTATTRLIEAAGLPGTASIWADPLHDGPVPGGLSDEALLEVRARYLSASVGDDLDVADELKTWRRIVARTESYDELVLWFEHDLFDQLNLVQLLDVIHARRPRTRPVSLVSLPSFPGRTDVKGLGELSPADFAPIFATRQRVRDDQYALARRAWEAFRADTPEALDALRREDTSALPSLGPSIARFLEEYPWVPDGLSRTERRLLTLADGSAVDVRSVFPRMHDGERFYYVTDLSLTGLIEALCRTQPPLLAWTPDTTAAKGALHGTVKTTAFGRAVLAGEQDRVRRCGIDRWLGGVHLAPGAPEWRWDPERDRVVDIARAGA